jgi:hypothetical protein
MRNPSFSAAFLFLSLHVLTACGQSSLFGRQDSRAESASSNTLASQDKPSSSPLVASILTKTPQEFAELSLQIIQKTVGDDEFEVDGYYFSGLESKMQTTLEIIEEKGSQETIGEILENEGLRLSSLTQPLSSGEKAEVFASMETLLDSPLISSFELAGSCTDNLPRCRNNRGSTAAKSNSSNSSNNTQNAAFMADITRSLNDIDKQIARDIESISKASMGRVEGTNFARMNAASSAIGRLASGF